MANSQYWEILLTVGTVMVHLLFCFYGTVTEILAEQR
jgi:hypothetical protein